MLALSRGCEGIWGDAAPRSLGSTTPHTLSRARLSAATFADDLVGRLAREADHTVYHQNSDDKAENQSYDRPQVDESVRGRLRCRGEDR